MKQIILFGLLLIILFSSFDIVAGKKHCQSYRKKLDSIQAKQRQANSNKRSNSLAAQEAKARKTWWQCENGKLKLKAKKQPKVKTKRDNKKKVMTSFSVNKQKVKPLKPIMPFSSQNSVMTNAKYQGEKLRAWLLFYQPKKICRQPKSMSQFSACAEEKRRQQIEFEQNY